MNRINVFRTEDDGSGVPQFVLDGHFIEDKAELIDEDTRWNGNNHVSVHTTDQFAHQRLYRTAGGRWVLNCWSQRVTVPETYEFLDDEQARTWLLVNESDDVIEKYLGAIPEERGPGRPSLDGDGGDSAGILFRPGKELRARIDAEAARRGTTRAALLRDIISTALA